MKLLKLRGLSDHWIDKDHLILHAAFQLLRDFVERERPERIDWNHDPRSGKAWREIRSLYRWWMKIRPNRREPLDAKGLKKPRMRFAPVPGKPYSRLVPYDKQKYRPYLRALSRQTALEQQWLNEDQRNLHRLIEVRPFLWT